MNQLPPGPAPAYSRGLEFTLNLLLSSMDPTRKLELARRLQDVCRHVERQSLEELEAEGRQEP